MPVQVGDHDLEDFGPTSYDEMTDFEKRRIAVEHRAHDLRVTAHELLWMLADDGLPHFSREVRDDLATCQKFLRDIADGLQPKAVA